MIFGSCVAKIRAGPTMVLLAVAAFVGCRHDPSLTLAVSPNPIPFFSYAPGHGTLVIRAHWQLTIAETGGTAVRVSAVTIRVVERTGQEVDGGVLSGPDLLRPNLEPEDRVPALGTLTLVMGVELPPRFTTIPEGMVFLIMVDAYDENSHHVSATLVVPQAPGSFGETRSSRSSEVTSVPEVVARR